MQPVRAVTGTAAPLDRSDVDTDQIIPSDWLKRVERTGFGKGLFAEWRDDRNFVLNDPERAAATILVAGPNFGTGSSREHAVWALMDYGFKAVVSPRFGDIFRNNCTKAGLVPVQVDAADGAALLAAVTENPALEVTVDVEKLLVSAPEAGIEAAFALDSYTQHRLLEGLDDIGLTMRHSDDVGSYERRRPAWMPSVPVRDAAGE
ncbi:MAG: 3-isopropylmalate dehydratase small subunit [Acidimicrobiales bacterium]